MSKLRNSFVWDGGLSFDDVLLVPTYSEVRSRLSPDASTYIGNTKLKIPMISSPMDTVTGPAMASELGSHGAMGVVHRFSSIREQIDSLREVSEHPSDVPVVAAVGVGREGRERFLSMKNEMGSIIDWIAIDIANGHSILMKEMVDFVKDNSDYQIMAGNVATGDGFAYLADAGVNAVRASIGSGAICSTRIMTGFGVPLLSTIVDCQRVRTENASYKDVSIIADGGIRYPSDMVKSIVAGADAVMAGGLFAGTIESPGDVVNIDGRLMKVYRGAASREIQEDKRGGLKPGTCAEGVSTHIPLEGKAKYVLDEFMGGLRSGMSYANAMTLDELRENASFIKITNAGLAESHAYGTRK
jgi:IMP dehydrogenase